MQKFEILTFVPETDRMVERAADQNVRIDGQAEDAAVVAVLERRFSNVFSIGFRRFGRFLGVRRVVVERLGPDFNVAVVEAAEQELQETAGEEGNRTTS